MKEEKQEKLVGEGVGFDRIRRITGYLVGSRYPGWKYKANSDMRDKLNKIIMEEYDKPLVEIAKHSGLECGVFASIDDDMDVITYGPIMEGIHTPNERLGLESFSRAYKVLTKLIAECK